MLSNKCSVELTLSFVRGCFSAGQVDPWILLYRVVHNGQHAEEMCSSLQRVRQSSGWDATISAQQEKPI